MNNFSKKKIYFDNAGSTPLDKSVLKEMFFYESNLYANPSAVYDEGVRAKNIIEESRKSIAKEINAHFDEIIFTGSGTESDALAIIGTVKNYELDLKNKKLKYKIPHIIISEIEHPAVLDNCLMLEREGRAEVTYLEVDEEGIVDLIQLENSLKENTILVSIMYANNEIGVIEPLDQIAKIIRKHRKDKKTFYPLFHTDACQAMNYLSTENVEKLGVDLMTFNSSKIYGPKGIGALYKKRNIKLIPLYEGGGQEFGLRSGTENISSIVGFKKALIITNRLKNKESKRLTIIRDYGVKKILSLPSNTIYNIVFNGSLKNRLPNNINFSILGIPSELVVIELSSKGICVSEKSACQSKNLEESYVINAIRKNNKDNNNKEYGSLRISLGRCNKKSDIDVLCSGIEEILKKYEKWK